MEDERPMARALALKLSHEGFEVTNAFDGGEGLEAIKKQEFDLVITDLMMPKVDGFKVLEEIHAEGLTTPVIVLTNLSQEEDEAKVRSLGARDFFVKSNTPISQIVEGVKKILT